MQPLAAVLSAEEVTELLGLSPPTLRRLVKDGHLRAHRLPGGRKWVFRADEVLESVGSWPAGDEGPEENGSDIEPPAEEPIQVAVDPTAVWCPVPAPLGSTTPPGVECQAAWIDAASRAGLEPVAVGLSEVEVAGRVYELRAGPRQRVRVVDDDGEDVWQLIDAVFVELAR